MKLNPTPQYLEKLIGGFLNKCAKGGQRNRQTEPNSLNPSNKLDFKNRLDDHNTIPAAWQQKKPGSKFKLFSFR